MACVCHDMTFCPDLVCIGYEDDVPIYVPRTRENNAIALKRERARDLEEMRWLRDKWEK
jgi:hypothetical protein